MFDVRRAGVGYAAYAAKILRKWRLTHSRVDILVIHARVLTFAGIVCQSDIRARLGIARSTMSTMMRRFERLGLVERERCLSDRRQLVVKITERGRAAFAEVRGMLGNDLLTPLVDCTLLFADSRTPVPIKRARLIAYIDTVRAHWGDYCSGPYPP